MQLQKQGKIVCQLKVTGCLRPTLIDRLPVFSEIAPPKLRRESHTNRRAGSRPNFSYHRWLQNVMSWM